MATVSPNCFCNEGNTENHTMMSLKQYFYNTQPRDELRDLVAFLTCLEYKQAVVYVQNAIRCDVLAEVLEEHGLSTTSIHELLPSKVRICRLLNFKRVINYAKIMVTSCVAHAMEIKNANIVIMFDEVESAPLYCHRITSKRARKGLVINFIRKAAYMRVLKEVEKSQNVTITKLPVELPLSSYFSDAE